MSKKTAKDDYKRRYVGHRLPKTVPPGRVLCHNHITHGLNWPSGVNGFRAWYAVKPYPGFLLCPCGWAGLRHYASKDHAKVQPGSVERVTKLEEKLGLWEAMEAIGRGKT
jgi:hypothetical protein